MSEDVPLPARDQPWAALVSADREADGRRLHADVEAARLVAEAADARDLLRPRAPAEHGLNDAGDEPALEMAERPADRCHPAARDALVHVDLELGVCQDRHL